MKPINISLKLLSDVVWQRILEGTAMRLETDRAAFFEKVARLDALRAQASYNTGSISAASSWLLYSLACYFAPKKILEVGTFIGRSAVSLALGADTAGAPGELHTCDNSNEIMLPEMTATRIVQYPRCGSTAMLKQLQGSHAAGSFDFIHLDGRLMPEDGALLQALLHPNAILALDDFEGIEKGVANMLALRNAGLFKGHTAIYPCREEWLRRYGFNDDSSLALMIPASLLRLTAQ